MFIGIQIAPTANLLTVIKSRCANSRQASTRSCPRDSKGRIMYDSTDFVNQSIHEVAMTLIEALVIVMLVIFAFLGSPRSVLIPVVAIPLSLVGTSASCWRSDFSINLLTLLALVLAIGLVVDDAIIVVENVNRHLESGHGATGRGDAGGARAGGTAILAMTVVLLAVYIPDRLPRRPHRRAVHRVRVHARRRRHRVRGDRAHALADDVLEAPEAAPRRVTGPAGKRAWCNFIDTALRRLRTWYQFRKLERSLSYTPVTAVLVSW